MILVTTCAVLLVVVALAMAMRSPLSRLALISPVFLFIGYYAVVRFPGDLIVANSQAAAGPALLPALGMISMAVGAVFAKPGSLVVLKHSDYEQARTRRIAWGIVVLGFAAAAAYFALLGSIPLAYGIGDLFGADSGTTMQGARRAATYAHRQGEVSYFGQGYLRLVFLQILPIAVGVLMALTRLHGRRQPLAHWMLLFATFSLTVLEGRIWPAVQLIVTLGVIFLTVRLLETRRKGTLRLFVVEMLKLTIPLFIIIVVMFYLQNISGRATAGAPLEAIYRRLYMTPTAMLYQLFPEYYPFRFGQTWLNDFRGVLPGPSLNFRYEVHQMIHGGSWGFTMSPTIFGSIYVNFGIPGLVGLPALIGWTIQTFAYRLLRSGTVLSFVLFATFSARFAITSTQDMIPVLVAIISVLLVLGIFHYFPIRSRPPQRVDILAKRTPRS